MNKLNRYTICGKEASTTSQVCHNPRWRGKVLAVIAALQRSTDRLKKKKRKVRKNTGWGNDLCRRPSKTSLSFEALVVDSRIPRLKAWGVCQTLATTDFLLNGGDGYDVLKKISTVAKYGTCEEILTDYLKEVGTENIKTGRIKS